MFPGGRVWFGLLLLLLAAGPADAADLALKRVMLSSGGVGYFEYEADIEGDTTVSLDVALDQVDDVLKSLVLYDSAGTAGEVTLPGRNPLVQSFADLPFDRAALGSAVALLNALQGSEVRVERAEPLQGRLVHVDPETIPGTAEAAPIAQTRVTLLTAAGLQQFVLQDVTSISFVDPDLQAKVATALQRIAAYRDEARRRLTLNLHGSGHHTVRVGYVVAVPLWKASYRLSLGADPAAATARLQGWAVLENMSGQAWQDVELTLLSGNPVTFRQALYESYYAHRPTVPVEAGGHVLPPPDTGAQPLAEATTAPGGAAHMLRKAAPPAMMQMAPTSAPVAAPPPPPAGIEAAAASEDATQIAFTLPYKVSAPAGQSLMLPLLDRELPAHRVDLYQPSVDRQHPLAAVELTNGSDTSLPPGVLTLYERATNGAASYVGDARLTAFPAGDKRMLSYAVDNKVAVDRNDSNRRLLVKAAIADGVIRVTQTQLHTTVYRIKAASPPVSLVIEHPRSSGGWTLKDPAPDGIAISGNAYRIPVTVADSQTTKTVTEAQPIEETIALVDLTDDRLQAFASATELDPKLRQALTDLAQRRQAVVRRRAELDRLKAERNDLVADEARVRDNLTAIGSEPALRKRLLDKFNQSETAIDSVTGAIGQSQAALTAAERDLATYIAGLRL